MIRSRGLAKSHIICYNIIKPHFPRFYDIFFLRNMIMNDVKENISVKENTAEHSAAKKNDVKIYLRPALVIFFSMLAIIICLSAATAVLAFRLSAADKPGTEEETVQVIEPEPEPFVPVVNNRVYDFYDEGDFIFLDDPTYGRVWVPASLNVPKHTYDYSGLELENGRYTYSENGEVISKTGIDISYHQGDINWDMVAADGIDFVIIRAGYRGYESGSLNADENFHAYIKGALNAGLKVGVYFYSQAVNTDEAIEEANFVMELINGYEIDYPVIFDWEIVSDETSRTKDISPETITECTAAFCDTISDGGYMPMFYGSRKFSLMKMDVSKLTDYDFWYAEYKDGHNEPGYPYDFRIWQYASDGRVNGIEGDVDLDICFYDYAAVPADAEEE